jgi:hypothetical protein
MNNTAPLEIRFQLRAKPRFTIDEPAECPGRGRLPQITRVLALAIHLEQLILLGDAKDYADIGRLSCLCRERVSQIMRLNYLAPDIQVELLYLPPTLTGRYPISETSMRRIANLLSWADQREQWERLKVQHRLGSARRTGALADH